MKHLMVLFVGLMCAFGASAQSSLIATLIHGDSISTFQSAEALKLAYDKAVDGDVITLSSGTFNAPSTISKGITIRGAGMMAFENATMNPTIISGRCKICETGNGSILNIESVRFESILDVYTIPGLLTFTKTYFRERVKLGNGTYDANTFNVRMIHCIFRNTYGRGLHIGEGGSSNSVVSIINSHIFFEHITDSDYHASVSCDNCSVSFNKNSAAWIYKAQFSNCVISSPDGYPWMHSSSTASGCVYVGPSTVRFFENCAPTLNKSFPKDTPIFKENTEVYELTDENEKNWLGTDGTQVGMHGGNLPFDPSVDAPMISKFNVASKTTADGKLSVEIEVKAD